MCVCVYVCVCVYYVTYTSSWFKIVTIWSIIRAYKMILAESSHLYQTKC